MEHEQPQINQILSDIDFIQALKNLEKIDLVSFISRLPLPIAILEMDSRLIGVNQQFADIFQSDALYLSGKLLNNFSNIIYSHFIMAIEKFQDGEEQANFEFYSKGHFYLSYFKVLHDIEQNINAVILICADVTRLKRREKVLILNNQKLHDHLFIDDLTGLPNKMAFDRFIQEKVVKNKQTLYAFMKIDLDHFKKFNQVHSYTYGDEILTEIGRLLNDELNADNAHIFRLNSASFVIVVQGMTQWAVLTLAERLKIKIMQENIALDTLKNEILTASIGIYHLSVEQDHDILQQLDLAVRQAKAQGQNSIHVLST